MSRLRPETLLAWTRKGPRYTSYPPAPKWSADFEDAAFHDMLSEVHAPAAVYVHVPFCREQCSFCGCNMVVAGRREPGQRYLDALEKQVAELPLPAERLEVVRIHLGGGTPTWFSPEELEQLFAILRRRFDTVEGCEISVEADPDVTTAAHVDTLAALGGTRISLGVQSFDETVLQAVNRPQRRDQVRMLLERARHHGMGGLNLDLMYGLPHQSLERFAATLDEVISLDPDRLAIFGYAHLPWLKPHMKKIEEAALPGPVDRARLFLHAHERLTSAGYQAIGMDHFAKIDDELSVAQRAADLHRNFMGYTTLPDVALIGLGMSGISELPGGYVQQKAKLARWWKAVEQGSSIVEKGYRLTAEDRLRRELISELMCNFTVDLDALGRRHGVEPAAHFAEGLAQLPPMIDDGLVSQDGLQLSIPEDTRLLVRNVAMAFDPGLRRPQPGGPRYSSTV